MSNNKFEIGKTYQLPGRSWTYMISMFEIKTSKKIDYVYEELDSQAEDNDPYPLILPSMSLGFGLVSPTVKRKKQIEKTVEEIGNPIVFCVKPYISLNVLFKEIVGFHVKVKMEKFDTLQNKIVDDFVCFMDREEAKRLITF